MTSTETRMENPFKLLSRFAASSVGAKVLMALTGIVMWGFVIGHMAGNLQVFLWPKGDTHPINEYANFLKTTPALLWGTRIALLVSIIVHIVTAVSLTRKNRAARPSRYAVVTPKKSTFASRTMPLTGLVVLLYVIMHLMHFTGGVSFLMPAEVFGRHDGADLHDVYGMLRHAFSNIIFVVVYIIGNGLLIAHLVHGSASVWQSLGLHHKQWAGMARWLGWSLVAAILAGNFSIPLVLYAWSLGG